MIDGTDTEKADQFFDQMLRWAQSAADLDNAAGYNVAINAMKYAASILNPAKYGKQVTDAGGNVQGYIIETGIRRPGDAGFAGSVPHETAIGPAVHPENGDVTGQDNVDGLDIND